MRAATTICSGPRSTSRRRPPGQLNSHNRWSEHGGLDSDITTTSTPTATGSPDGTTITTDEYGNPSTTPATTPTYNYLGTTQRQTDHLTGLTLMGIRLYTPTTGRFLTQDPIYGGNATTYGYPAQPTNKSDASGQCERATKHCIIRVLTTTEPFPNGFLEFLRGELGTDYIMIHEFKVIRYGEHGGTADQCSKVPDSALWFDFTLACHTHDLGYDLLRYFKQKRGLEVPGGRARIDKLFYGDMKRFCRYGPRLAKPNCYGTAAAYYGYMAYRTRADGGLAPR